MIRPLFLFFLAPALVSLSLAQNSSPGAPATSSWIPCVEENGPPSAAPHKWVAVSAGAMTRYRIGGKEPKYPEDALRARVDGRVVLFATVSAAGQVEELCVSQGPEVLRQAAFDAVKTWKYKPFEVNGQPVEVKTIMNVVFVLH